jgi:hypothetical protein
MNFTNENQCSTQMYPVLSRAGFGPDSVPGLFRAAVLHLEHNGPCPGVKNTRPRLQSTSLAASATLSKLEPQQGLISKKVAEWLGTDSKICEGAQQLAHRHSLEGVSTVTVPGPYTVPSRRPLGFSAELFHASLTCFLPPSSLQESRQELRVSVDFQQLLIMSQLFTHGPRIVGLVFVPS